MIHQILAVYLLVQIVVWTESTLNSHSKQIEEVANARKRGDSVKDAPFDVLDWMSGAMPLAFKTIMVGNIFTYGSLFCVPNLVLVLLSLPVAGYFFFRKDVYSTSPPGFLVYASVLPMYLLNIAIFVLVEWSAFTLLMNLFS